MLIYVIYVFAFVIYSQISDLYKRVNVLSFLFQYDGNDFANLYVSSFLTLNEHPLFVNHYFSGSGASMMNILRPSIFSRDSIIAISSNSPASRSKTSRPKSLCVIARPRKRTVALTLSPFLI